MIKDYCPQCESKDAEIERLKLEIERLKNVIKAIKNKLLSLAVTIDQMLQKLRGWVKEAQEITDQKSGVPRGIWAYCKGILKIGHPAIAMLEYVRDELRELCSKV